VTRCHRKHKKKEAKTPGSFSPEAGSREPEAGLGSAVAVAPTLPRGERQFSELDLVLNCNAVSQAEARKRKPEAGFEEPRRWKP
jgi:hypothetical protein